LAASLPKERYSMRTTKPTVALLGLSLLAAGSAVAVRQSLADPLPNAPRAFTEAEFKQLKPALDLKNQPWTSIPWKYSLTDARKLAAETKKPIFMVINTGNVMGCV
jgi:hypothetical protein